MKIIELAGPKSLKALNAYCALLIGVKYLPQYATMSFEDFYGSVALMSEDERKLFFKEAAMIVELTDDEIKALLHFVRDPNGVPYGDSNIQNLKATELLEAIVAVCLVIASWPIDLVSEAEKKKLKNSVSTLGESTPEIPRSH